MMAWFAETFAKYGDILAGLLRAVVEGLVVAAVLAAFIQLRQRRDRKAAREQIAEQLLRVLGVRLLTKQRLGPKSFELDELPRESLRGRAALARLQWQVDLYRGHLSAREIRTLQGAIEGLERVSHNPGSASHYYATDAVPSLLQAFLPRSAASEVMQYVEGKHWSELLATREDFLQLDS